MPNLGAGELLIILALVLLIFGGTKLPKLARSLGRAQSEFKSGLSEAEAEAEASEGEGTTPPRSSGGGKPGGSSAKNGSH